MNMKAEKLKAQAIEAIQKIHGDKTITASDAYQAIEEVGAAADCILEAMKEEALADDIEL
jgi:hypothetical protein